LVPALLIIVSVPLCVAAVVRVINWKFYGKGRKQAHS